LTKKRKILIVCGTGIATSTVVALKVEEFLKRSGMDVELKRCMTSEARTASKGVDLIISTTQVPDVDVKVLSGIPYITGMNVPKLEQEILEYLEQLPD
jgi:PTS system galactitol-specific IIB component